MIRPTVADEKRAAEFVKHVYDVRLSFAGRVDEVAYEIARVRSEERRSCANACADLRDKRRRMQDDPILGSAFRGEAAGADQCERLILERGP